MRTFAAELGIVPTITIKNVIFMERVCIFRVSARLDVYRVYRRWILGVGTVYEVYCGRKHISGVSRYLGIEDAIGVAVALAKADLYFIKEGENIQ